jgi:hypothetical protein
MSQAPSPIRAYYRKLVTQLVYGALIDWLRAGARGRADPSRRYHI